MKISAFFLMIALLAGCAGSGSSTRASNTYRENLGAYPPGNIVRTLDEALQTRYGYRFARQEESVQDIYYETDWRDLQATDDERAIGIDMVRIRIIVNCRPRNRSASTAMSFAATFRAEVLSRVNMTGVYEPVDMTPERELYFEEITEFIKTELQTQFRF